MSNAPGQKALQKQKKSFKRLEFAVERFGLGVDTDQPSHRPLSGKGSLEATVEGNLQSDRSIGVRTVYVRPCSHYKS